MADYQTKFSGPTGKGRTYLLAYPPAQTVDLNPITAKLPSRLKGARRRHEAVFDFCSSGAAARRVLVAGRDHGDVRLLDPDQLVGGGKAVRGVRQDAAIQLSVRHRAGADDRRD